MVDELWEKEVVVVDELLGMGGWALSSMERVEERYQV